MIFAIGKSETRTGLRAAEFLPGRLGSADMGTVANAAALAVALLAGKECPALDLNGWLGQWSTNSDGERAASGSVGSPEAGAVA